MENKTKQLELNEFKIYRHIDAIESKLHHYSVEHPSIKFKGFGTDYSRDLAIKIAVNECLERQHFEISHKSLGVRTTSGYAAHNTYEEAKEAAICELLERDALLYNWLHKRPPNWLSNSELSIETQNHALLLKEINFQLKIGVIATNNNRFCLVGAVINNSNLNKIGAVFSASCHKRIEFAQKSITKELRRAVTVIINREKEKAPNIHDGKKNKANEHFFHYQDPNHFNSIQWYFNNSSKNLESSNFDIETSPINITYAPPWKFCVAHAKSDLMQNFYFGSPKLKRINRKRIKMNWNPGFKLNKDLHILP